MEHKIFDRYNITSEVNLNKTISIEENTNSTDGHLPSNLIGVNETTAGEEQYSWIQVYMPGENRWTKEKEEAIEIKEKEYYEWEVAL